MQTIRVQGNGGASVSGEARGRWPGEGGAAPHPQSPFERILAGMVAAGLVLEAICAFLSLTPEALRGQLARFGLPLPPDRPMRKPCGARPWTVVDARVLISRWSASIPVAMIAMELDRSAGAVRSKARRLGLYRRNRGDLLKVTADPVVAGATPGAGPIGRGAATGTESAPVGAVATADAAALPSSRCKPNRITWNDDLDLNLARRWFAGQDRHGIANDLGLTEAQIRSRATRMGLPPRDRAMIVPDYIEGRPYDTSLENSVIRRRCVEGNMYFWGVRNGPRTSPKIMQTKRYRELRSGLGEYNVHV